MSDSFINTVTTMEIGGSVAYYAASQRSFMKVEMFIKTLDPKRFYLGVIKQGRERSRITITRIE